jgi:two-component system response regulator FixJ
LDRVIHIVDDDEAVRRSAAFMLKHAGFRTESYVSGVAFLERADTVEDGCVLLDINMPDMNGLEVQAALIARGLTMPIIVLTGSGEINVAAQAMRAGAINYIEKPYAKENLLAAIEEVYARQGNANGANVAEAGTRLASLSGQERDVLDALVAGIPNSVIAQNLNVPVGEVEIHRANMMEKLRVRSLAEALHLAFVAKSGQNDSGIGAQRPALA